MLAAEAGSVVVVGRREMRKSKILLARCRCRIWLSSPAAKTDSGIDFATTIRTSPTHQLFHCS